ncbi:MAG: hypothetical protein ACLP8A_14850 [Methylovirgula sp.]
MMKPALALLLCLIAGSAAAQEAAKQSTPDWQMLAAPTQSWQTAVPAEPRHTGAKEATPAPGHIPNELWIGDVKVTAGGYLAIGGRAASR